MKESKLYQIYREVLVLLEFGNLQALRPFNLTVHQFDALCILAEGEGIRMGELKNRLLSDNSKITRTVDFLEAKRYAERKPDPADRRAQMVYITEVGRALCQEATAVHTAYLSEKFNTLSDLEKDQLHQLLIKLRYAHE